MTMLPPSSKEYTYDLTRPLRPNSPPHETIVEDKIRSIETLLRHLATSQVTVQEVKAVHAVIASLTQEAQDLNTGRKNSTLRTREQLNDNRDRLTKFEQWIDESSDGIVAWTREELTRGLEGTGGQAQCQPDRHPEASGVIINQKADNGQDQGHQHYSWRCAYHKEVLQR